MEKINEIFDRLRPRPKTTAESLKNETKDYLERAEKLELENKFTEASVLYKRVVTLIHANEGTPAVDEQLKETKRKANEFFNQAIEISNRTSDLNSGYQEIISQLAERRTEETDETAKQNETIGKSLTVEIVENSTNEDQVDTPILFHLDQGAQMFYLAKDSSIQTTSESMPLTIFEITEDDDKCGLLKLGSWIYPLHPLISPSFKTSYDAYIFPNNSSLGEFVGLMFDESVEPEVRHSFEQILMQNSIYKEEGNKISENQQEETVDSPKQEALVQNIPAELPYDTATVTGKIAAKLVGGSLFLTLKLNSGVNKTSGLFHKASQGVQSKLVPASKPVKVYKGIHIVVAFVRGVTAGLFAAIRLIIMKISEILVGLIRIVAPNFGKIQRKLNADGSEEVIKLSGITGIGHAGLASFGLIFSGLQGAAVNLATNLSNETISVVKYKYGDDVSTLTENAASALGNGILVFQNVATLGTVSVATKVVAQAGTELAKETIPEDLSTRL